ncbi:hemocytin isoform X2 [Contarinia nasturtii]|uniref:hemocytin isoform X2 n=1 Tax=Contarinia nasturtii TaxID=265458 RepID=UPI0012D3BCBF|nr:hemocytin isoform X2 [Contarinia nasturtii]
MFSKFVVILLCVHISCGEFYGQSNAHSKTGSAQSYGRTCQDIPRTILNASKRCSIVSKTCTIECLNNYQLPNGETKAKQYCADGTWLLENLDWTDKLACEPICMPPCKNNGICMSPGTCSCPENFIGPYCEHEKKLCLTKPVVPHNSRLICSSTSCTITCAKGYTFPDGSSITNMMCENGEWKPSRPDQTFIPDCQPTCSPACQNGGVCLSYNVCQCAKDYRGKQCQFNVDVCSPKKIEFNGAYSCSGDNDALRCKLSCIEGVAFSFPPAAEYVCEYEKGYFTPSPVPRCNYSADVEVIRGNELSHSYSTVNRTTIVGGGLYGNRTKKVRKIRKKGLKSFEIEGDGEQSGSYEKIIIKNTKTIIVRKGQKKTQSKGAYEGDEYEYEEYEDEDGGSEFYSGMQAIGVQSLYISSGLTVKHRVPKPATCTTWNGNKVKTFDGLIYTHNLRCSHTLIQDKIDGSFAIVLRACSNSNQAPCPHALEIMMSNTKYILESINGSVVLFKEDKEMAIPMQIMGLRISKVGLTFKISLELIGITIYWDAQRGMNIETTAALFNRTAGLCGTLDQDVTNDFASKDGTVHKTTATFVDAWQTSNSACQNDVINDEGMELVCPDDVKLAATEMCKKLLNNEKFNDCLKNLKREAILEVCISDFCYCRHANRKECACNGLTVFAKECLFQGNTLQPDWRNMELCPLSCENGRVYKACGPIYEKSCGSAVENEISTSNCNEGCFCPDGTIQYAGNCIRIDECPCALRGKTFNAGSEIKKDCNTCKCEKGVWKCSDLTCGARCSAIGDPHYQTFDGKHFDFMGKCSYYLLKTDDDIEITAENVACPGSISESMNFGPVGVDMPSCTKSVAIKVKHENQTATIHLKQGRIIQIDGVEITKIPLKIFDGFMRIRFASSTMLLVAFRDGLKLWWDGMTRVYIDAPISYRGKTKGLCGTFDSNQQNDFLTPENDIESSVGSFANKWRTKESCDFVNDDVNIPHPCTANTENKKRALEVCAKLKSKIFEECHWFVDWQPYYEDCMYDMCACKSDTASCMCSIFTAYANECNEQGSIIHWRNSIQECAIKCPAGQVFEECSDRCYRSCADMESLPKTCRTKCVEGCRCPEGQALDENNECIPISMCPCAYKGLSFNAGYKEVRPGTKHLDLCTCDSADWKCVEATDSDKDKYPPAADLRNQCLVDKNEEFTTCQPVEPKTCKNMNNYVLKSAIDCRPGCVCKKGYVLDVALNKCVLPVDCSCHHGSKSYSDGEQIKSDCNTCICESGNWVCTKRICPATCTSYGDSHFTTYDGKDFDFQGACSYVLSKGVIDSGEGFTVTLQNVMCGSQGVTCAKSVTITLHGNEPESITLNSDTTVPGALLSRQETNEIVHKGKKKIMQIHRAGVFVVVEVPGLGVQIKWDRGTRIYVQLTSRWKGRVLGLCGNFDGDALNDFESPSTGLESSAVLFGNSWKLEDYCPQPTEQIDACSTHPERKIWAEKKCGILKSSIFSACHSEVDVDKFMKRCIFDSCACDQGGDCECLCTAIAAYAHVCTMKGIPIRWRTQHFCPMQCDPHCSEYKPCISACGVETCDNILDQGKNSKLCTEDTCVEGCHIKPCPYGEIYLNDSYTECVSKSICKPICLTLNGVDYFEGDVIKSDNCQTCHCSKGKQICVGVPCTVTTTLPFHAPVVMNQDESATCKTGWSEWINQESLSDGQKSKNLTKFNDNEPLPNAFMLKNFKNSAFCDANYMSQIECRSVDSHLHPKVIGEDAECSLERGLVCEGQCHDYEIRVFCNCIIDDVEIMTLDHTTPRYVQPIYQSKIIEMTTATPTVYGSICNPAIPHVEKPGNCHEFYHCTMNTSGVWTFVEKSCGKDMMFHPQAMVCDHIDNVKRIKPECGQLQYNVNNEVNKVTEIEKIIEKTTIIQKETKNPLYGSICNPAIPHVEKPGNCHEFYHCTMNTSGVWTFVEKSCGKDMMYHPQAMVCDHIDNVKRIKPQCGSEWENEIIQDISVISKLEKKCPIGHVWSECAVPCGRACHFYDKFLQKSGLCTGSWNSCEKGCVPETAAADCGPGYYWRDNKLCVKKADCTCQSDDGKIVKPGSVYKESDCKICQCIDNLYVCDVQTCQRQVNSVTTVVKPITSEIIEESITVVKKPETEPTQVVISTVTPPADCAPENLIPMVNGKIPLPDTAFNASSYLTTSFKPHFSRLNSQATPFSRGCWSPEIDDQKQYLQIAFEKPVPLYGIILQGSPTFDQYVTSFKILHSHEGGAFHNLVDETTKSQIFNGPIDSRTPVKSMFKIPIEAKVIRIYPLTWHGKIAIRTELLGCSPYKVVEEANTIPPHHEQIEEQPICDDPLGVDTGILRQNQIKLSSFKTSIPEIKAKESLKLSSLIGWQPNIDSPNEYVLFDFLQLRNVTGVKTKGGDQCWVSAYYILYTQDFVIWNKLLNGDGSGEQLFLGNFDGINEKSNYFRFPLKARAIKVIPTKWHNCIEMKIEPVGCFLPYEYSEIVLESTTSFVPINVHCSICPGVDSASSAIESVCKCKSEEFWNGVDCVARSMCPCVVNHLTYGVGAHFESDDCSQCTCVLGGIVQCKPQDCKPCGKGLRRVKSSACLCLCEPCPAGHLLCPTSGACIPESSWCNGVQDCPDDEINCSYKHQAQTTKVITKVKEKIVITKTCPEPKCPPGFYVKVVPSKKGKPSAYSPLSNAVEGIYKESNEDNTEIHSKLPLPSDTPNEKIKDDFKCVEYNCIPERVTTISQTEKIVCAAPSCPSGYEVVFETTPLVAACSKYKCEPIAKHDVVCKITGRTFSTFDGTEYKYDVCDHILARDLSSNNWTISIQKNCSTGGFVCRKQITITDKTCNLVVILNTDSTVKLDDYEYTIDQLKNSVYSQRNLFTISKVGNSILYVSNLQDIWIRLDDTGDVKVGISSKYKSFVDGLCGYYNEYSNDDKRLPDGTEVISTVDFGDGWWRDPTSKPKCEPNACSQQEQDTAWEMCNKIKDEAFESCANVVNVDKFISKCLETACECLKSGKSAQNCKCSLLQSYVSDCMAADENLHFDTWHSKFDCVVECPAPLVHRDCYRRRCEPSCDTLNKENCPSLPGTCFSGCYCPEGTVRKGEACVPVTDCKNCVCDGFGSSQYITYDRKNFTFNGNCTYLLSRDVKIPNAHTFQVYVSLAPCPTYDLDVRGSFNSEQSCTQSLHILYGQHIIHLQKSTQKQDALDTLVDGIAAPSLPFKNEWVLIEEQRGKGVNIELIKSLVEVNTIFDDLSFSIKIPSAKYSNSVEGLCGNCNGDPSDDLKPNPKHLDKVKSNNLNDILQTWLADEPALNLKEKCISETKISEVCVPLPPNDDPCLQLLDQKTFGQCHLIVNALSYVSMCQNDMCKTGPNQKGACSHFAAYARECSRNGICVDWKKGACSENFECPIDMEYKVCNCHKTCDMVKEKSNILLGTCAEPVDGCFCKDGKVLNQFGKCVTEKECSPCDDNNHFVGDKWQPDKCTDCECTTSGKVSCTKKQCAVSGAICQVGFKEVIIQGSSNDCCPKYKCVPELVSSTCPLKPQPQCSPYQNTKMIIDTNNCTSYVCVCKPLNECASVQNRPLRAGEKLVKQTTGCCPQDEIVCDKSTCPIKPTKCDQLFYELIKKDDHTSDLCCDEFICVPPKNLCLLQIDGKTITKKIGESWPTDEPCIKKKCTYGANGSPIISEEKEICPVKLCGLGFRLDGTKDKCCGVCIQDKCVLDGKTYALDSTWYSKDNCTTFKCSLLGNQLVVSSSQSTCPDVSACPKEHRYFEDCCERCKQSIEDKKSCLAISLSDSQTIGLVEMNQQPHGQCINTEPIRGFTECHGACDSGTKYNRLTMKQDKKCLCCSVASSEELKIPVKCTDGFKQTIAVSVPKTCNCKPCEEDESHKHNDQFLDFLRSTVVY